jgi:ubiquinone/menaquinone biosynthesis C-methylase UbiE
VKDVYDRIADRYASWVMTGPPDAAVTEHLALFAQHLPSDAHVLDLGCGGGLRLAQLADRFSLTAVDTSS